MKSMAQRSDAESPDERLFGQEEMDIIQSTWTSFMKDGTAEIGLVLLYRFFTEVPEVKTLFYETEIDGLPENFTKDDLRERKKFMKHAERLGSTLDILIKNMKLEDKFIKKCFSIGVAHKKHNVELRHFDLLGEVLVRIVQRALEIDSSHASSQAWKKTYGTIATYIKRGLSS